MRTIFLALPLLAGCVSSRPAPPREPSFQDYRYALTFHGGPGESQAVEVQVDSARVSWMRALPTSPRVETHERPAETLVRIDQCVVPGSSRGQQRPREGAAVGGTVGALTALAYFLLGDHDIYTRVFGGLLVAPLAGGVGALLGTAAGGIQANEERCTTLWRRDPTAPPHPIFLR